MEPTLSKCHTQPKSEARVKLVEGDFEENDGINYSISRYFNFSKTCILPSDFSCMTLIYETFIPDSK